MLPARKQQDSRDDESLLMRSAESLGRMIGTLQRQLDGATKRLAVSADDGSRSGRGAKKGGRKRTAGGRASAAKPARKASGRSATKKTRGAAKSVKKR
jgi:hypothetical protein